MRLPWKKHFREHAQYSLSFLRISVLPTCARIRANVSSALGSAIQKNGITHAVLISSTGAEQAEGTGPVLGLHEFEQKLEAIPALNFLSLRCGYFMENFLAQVGILQSFAFMAGPLRRSALADDRHA